MKAAFAHYKTRRKHETRSNPHFRKTQHRIHRLMHLFLGLIALEWLVSFLSNGFSWTGVGEIALALAVHVVVETLALHGFAGVGGLIILADEALNLAGLAAAARAGHARWDDPHTLLTLGCAIILLSIGLYLVFSRDVNRYAVRAREILLAHRAAELPPAGARE